MKKGRIMKRMIREDNRVDNKNQSLQTLFEVVGSSVVFIVIMGLPATIASFASYEIPISLLSYRKIIEAGVLPGLITISLLALYIKSKETSKIKEMLSLPAIPLIFPGVILIILILIAVYSYVFWAVGFLVSRPFLLIIEKEFFSSINLFLIGFSIILLIFCAVKIKNVVRKKRNKGNEKKDIRESRANHEYKRKLEYVLFPQTLKQWYLAEFVNMGGIPILFFLGLIFIKIAIRFYFNQSISFLNLKYSCMLSILLGLPYGLFMMNTISVPHLNVYITKKINFIRKFNYLLLVSTIVCFYSFIVYPHLPRSFGGGKLDKIDIILSSNILDEDINKSMNFVNYENDDNIRINDLEIIDITSSYVIGVYKHEGGDKSIMISVNFIETMYPSSK